ncbi:MAG TPA: CbiX/SirB N-terminal domain-containing protein [Opitutaceae bacterium]|nr:CbiX/SirB N-terminal domain-containing protein [Opitutaceae bacterium]
MIIALIDNGSLEPAAQLNLRAVATALSDRVGLRVEAVSWKHSDRVPADALGGISAWTLAPFVRAQVARGERDFVFVPFFISAQGAIGSALRGDLEKLQREAAVATPFEFIFTPGLAAQGAIAGIVAERVRETIALRGLHRPSIVVVDHGGPSAASAALRDSLADEARTLLGVEIGPLAAASMEGSHGPLLAEQVGAAQFARGDVVVAPLFLSPGRHAGDDGDVQRICRAAEAQLPSLRCHVTGLVGTHSRAIEPLVLALRETLKIFHAHTLA